MKRPGRQLKERPNRPPSRLSLILAASVGIALSLALASALLWRHPANPDARANAAELALVAGLILFSTLTGLFHVSGRRQWMRRESGLKAEIAVLRARLDRADLFLATNPKS